MSLDLSGRRYLVTGLTNEESFAWHTASRLQSAGAEVLLTSFGRALRIARRAAVELPQPAEVLELDVNVDHHFDALCEQINARWLGLDGVLHSIAMASPSALGGNFLTTPADDTLAGFRTSVQSLQKLSVTLAPLLAQGVGGGSVVAMTVDSSRAMPGYDWMGVYKASLVSVVQYLATYLGPSNIRVNLVASGPFESFAARGISTFNSIANYYEEWAPLGWDRQDPTRAVGAVLFLLSDLARWTTGTTIHADGGMHARLGGVGATFRTNVPAAGQ